MTQTPTTPLTELSPTREGLGRLLERGHAGPCVTLYLPGPEPGPRAREFPIRVRNMLGRASERLRETEGGGKRLDDSIARAELLRTEGPQPEAGSGVAVFLTDSEVAWTVLGHEVPESLFIGDHFALRFAVPAINSDHSCLVLALSQEKIRLLSVDESGVERLDLPDTPTSMDELMGVVEEQKSLQYHSGTSPSSGDASAAGRGGRRAAMFHGQGAPEADSLVRLHELLKLIDKAMAKVVQRAGARPIILAGDERVLSEYRSLTKLDGVAPEAITGSIDHLDDERIADRARSILEDRSKDRERRALLRFNEESDPKLRRHDLGDIAIAAGAGQVELLLAPWSEGSKPEENTTLEQAIYDTLRTSGEVEVLKSERVPGDAPVAAVLRPGGPALVESSR